MKFTRSIAILFAVPATATADQPRSEYAMQDTQRPTIFALIDTVKGSLTLGKGKIELAFGTTLKAVRENEYFTFLEGFGRSLADGSEIDKIDLRLSKSNSEKVILVFHLKRGCVSPEMVRAHYGDLEPLDVPRGRTNDEEFTYTTMYQNVRLGFGFKEANPDCLSTVVLEK